MHEKKMRIVKLHVMARSSSHHDNLVSINLTSSCMYFFDHLGAQLCGEQLSVQETAPSTSTRRVCKCIVKHASYDKDACCSNHSFFNTHIHIKLFSNTVPTSTGLLNFTSNAQFDNTPGITCIFQLINSVSY